MAEVGISLFTGISTAALLFLVGSGLTLIFGAMRIINIAHGSFYMIGAYLMYELATRASIPVALAIPLATGLMFVVSMVIERGVIRFTYGRDHLIQLLATYALVLVFADLALIVWGTSSKSVDAPVKGTWHVLGLDLPAYRIIVIAIAVAIGISLWLLLTRTRLGWMIRASSENPQTLEVIGYNVPRLNTFIFGLGGALAGLGGAIYAPMGSVGPGLDNAILIEAFVVTIVGGLGSILGAAVISLVIGVLEGIVLIVVPELSSSLIFIIMIVALAIRPWGLFGKPER